MTTIERARAKIRTWRECPAQFVADNFGVTPDPWQIEVLEALSGGMNPCRRLAMKACTGPGKSAVLAWIGWWRLACFAEKGEHPKGAALSITKDNLKDNLWAELAKWQNRSQFLKSAFTWTKEQIYANDHPETWFLSARSFAKDADAEAIGRSLSGLHSRFPFILLDETGEMPVAVLRAAEQIFTGSPRDALIAQAGNPTSIEGVLYLTCNNLRALWAVVTITADPDDPKRTPRISIEYAREQIATHGRDNPWVMATILGLFPPAGFNSLLSVDEVEAAMSRSYHVEELRYAARIITLDVARQGDDRSCIAKRQGLQAYPFKIFRNADSVFLTGQVAREEDEWEADGVIVDGTGGWGSGVLDNYKNMQRQAFDCQYAGSPFNPKYLNKRAEIWFEMAKWVKAGGALPKDPELVGELTTPTYSFKGDKFILEPKEQVKARLGRSPDKADALAMTFAFPIAPKSTAPFQSIYGRMGVTGGNVRGVESYDPFGGL